MRQAIMIAIFLSFGCDPGLVDDRQGGDERSTTIYNGVLDTGHPEVGEVMEMLCTGTLIGNRTVLTAAHCLHPARTGKGTGTFVIGGRTYVGTAVVHPGWSWYSMNDVAIIRLNQPVYGIAPRALCTQAPALGQPIVMVGFGRNDHPAYPNRTKLKGGNTISYVGAYSLHTHGLGPNQSQGCFGDSGGPALASNGCLIGTFSWIWWHGGYQMACQEHGEHSRVDIHRAWINANAGDPSVRWISPTPSPTCRRVCDKHGCRQDCSKVCDKHGCR